MAGRRERSAAAGEAAPHVGARGWSGDTLLVCLLAAGAATAAWYGSRGLDDLLVRGDLHDVWFEADCPRVFENVIDFRSVQNRAAVHPLFALWTYPSVAALRGIFGLEPVVAIRLLRAATAAACAAAFYGVLRAYGCRRLDSLLFTLLGATSAGAMFWFVVPETYPPGLLAMLLALGLVAVGARRKPPLAWDLLVNVATLSFTITNWMAGLAATFVRWPWRRAIGIVILAACLALGLMVIQQQIFPSAAVLPISSEEREYVLHPDAGGPGRVLLSFVFHSMVMPATGTSERYGPEFGPIMTVQHSWPGSAGLWGVAAASAWGVLLALGVWATATGRGPGPLRAALGLIVVGQLVLHVLYGLETFTYACHFGPLLVLVAAMATLSRARRFALGLAAVLIVCAAINNVAQFRQARAFVEQRAAATLSVDLHAAEGQRV